MKYCIRFSIIQNNYSFVYAHFILKLYSEHLGKLVKNNGICNNFVQFTFEKLTAILRPKSCSGSTCLNTGDKWYWLGLGGEKIPLQAFHLRAGTMWVGSNDPCESNKLGFWNDNACSKSYKIVCQFPSSLSPSGRHENLFKIIWLRIFWCKTISKFLVNIKNPQFRKHELWFQES